LMIIVGGISLWRSLRDAYRLRATTNNVSGLPNFYSLRHDRHDPEGVLVAARVRNYAEVVSALPTEQEQALVAQIAGRLTVGNSRIRLYQGDEGTFVWFVEPAMARAL